MILFKSKIDKFLHSNFLFLICFGVLFLCWNLKIVEVAFVFLIIVAILVFNFCVDLSPIALLICLAPCVKHKGFQFSTQLIYILIPFVIGLLVSVVFYFIRNFVKLKKKIKFGSLWLGLLLGFIACFCGGLFSPDFSILRMLAATGTAVLSYIVYFLLINTTDGNLKNYIYKILLTICSLAVFETVCFYYPFDELFFIKVFNKTMNIGWLMTNSAATLYSIVLPFCLYKSLNSNRPWLHFSFFIILCGGLLLTLSRTSLLFAGILVPFIVIYTFLKGDSKQKKQMIITFLIGIIFFILFYFGYQTQLNELIGKMLDRGAYLNNRDVIWEYCFEEFKKYPSFGIGFFGEDASGFTYPARLLHNTPLQIICCTGIIGTLLFIPLFYQRYKLLTTKFSLFKFFALFSVLLWELGGLFDINFVRIFQLVIIYTIMAACENETNREAFALTKNINRINIKTRD